MMTGSNGKTNGGTNKTFAGFMALWSADFLASIASGMTAFALSVYVFEMTGSATSVALTTLFAFLPSLLLNPLAGVLADRFDRRLLMIIGDGCSAIGLVYILLAIMSGQAAIWQIYVGVGLSSVFVALVEPAFKATITDLLTTDQFAKASGLVQLAGSAKYLLSPFMAGFLLAVTDIRLILILDIATVLVTVPVTALVRRWLGSTSSERAKQSLLADFAEGFRTVSSNRGLLWMIFSISLVTLYIGMFQILITPMMLTLTDAQTLGVVMSVASVGMLVSSVLISAITITRRYVRQLVVGLALAGLLITLVGLTPNIIFIGVCSFLFMASLPFLNTSADVLIRANIPDDQQGRAWGLIGILSQCGYVVAYAVAGPLADGLFNPLLVEGGPLAATLGQVMGVGEGRGIGLMLIVAGILLVVSAVVMARLRSIRALEEALKREQK